MTQEPKGNVLPVWYESHRYDMGPIWRCKHTKVIFNIIGFDIVQCPDCTDFVSALDREIGGKEIGRMIDETLDEIARLK